MQQWEYLVRKNVNESELNTLGKDGWELVFVHSPGCYCEYTFKRPKITIQSQKIPLFNQQTYTSKKEWTMEEIFPGIEK